MGIIGGLIQFNQISVSPTETVDSMLRVQRHRDDSPMYTLVGNNYCFGVANKHALGSVPYETAFTALQQYYKTNKVSAFVDGVLLDVPEQVRRFRALGHDIQAPISSIVVASAYREWGTEFMRHLEGEFACVIWDGNTGNMILSRDPYGHKPLHYFANNLMAVVASEIKGILASGIARAIDQLSLSDFLTLNCVPCPKTIFKDINQVLPGETLVISESGIQKQKYWHHYLCEDESLSLEENVDEVTEGIRQAVKKRMIKDETFCFLSGGIDSSALLSVAAEISTKSVTAITVGFDEAEADELNDARLMADHVGARHLHITAKPESFLEMMDKLVYHHDSPFTDTSAYPTYVAANLARNYTDLILTGDGPDQTMGGSSHHVFAIKNRLFKSRSSLCRPIWRFSAALMKLLAYKPDPQFFFKLRRYLYRRSLSPVSAAYDIRSYFPDLVKEFLTSPGLWNLHVNSNPFRWPEDWFREAGDVSDLNKYLYADIAFYIPDDLMIKVDRMSMANGLETLSPFQDVRLAEKVNKLPGHMKIRPTTDGAFVTKYVLKEVCRNRFPEQILKKKKQGFGIPLEKWLRQDKGKYIKEVLLDPRTLNRGYFKEKGIVKFVTDFVDCRGDYYYPSANGVVALLTLELWHRMFLDNYARQK